MNISLVGMMGSGKTTIGELLANELSFDFVDTDSEIVKLANKSINDIFSQQGESSFREIETSVLEKIISNDNQVISTGGGIIKSDKNISLLLSNSIVVYLYADCITLYERVKNDTQRPLLKVDNLQEKVKSLLLEREEKYKKAHIVIDTVDKNSIDIVNEIIGKLNEYSERKN